MLLPAASGAAVGTVGLQLTVAPAGSPATGMPSGPRPERSMASIVTAVRPTFLAASITLAPPFVADDAQLARALDLFEAAVTFCGRGR